MTIMIATDTPHGDIRLLEQAILDSAGLTPRDIAWNALMPHNLPGNRLPTPSEISEGLPAFRARVDAIGPKLILAVGYTVARAICFPHGKPTIDMWGEYYDVDARGDEFARIPMVEVRSPAYLTRKLGFEKPILRYYAGVFHALNMASVAKFGSAAVWSPVSEAAE
jgi:uracil-DNA glycosylase family 4